MSHRRRSGLWRWNAHTGLYEQPPLPAGPPLLPAGPPPLPAGPPPLPAGPPPLPAGPPPLPAGPPPLPAAHDGRRPSSSDRSAVPALADGPGREKMRRGSVPGRSPLQDLESWSKEEKRARAQQAEHAARQRGLASRHPPAFPAEKARVAGDARVGQSPPAPLAPADPANAYRPRTEAADPAWHPPPFPRGSTDLGRAGSRKYRARDAGFAGGAAAASAAPTIAASDQAAQRGQAAHERRKSHVESPAGPVAHSGPHPRPPVAAPAPPTRAASPEHRRCRRVLPRADGRERPLQPLDARRTGRVARLTAEDLDLGQASDAWWERGKRTSTRTSASASASAGRRSSPRSKRAPRSDPAQDDAPCGETANGFQPRLFLKCGPLLRYNGIRREAVHTTARASTPPPPRPREIWRGSVLIVTEDDQSDLTFPPTIRLFAQPMGLHEPPPQHRLDSGRELPPEDEDPVAGQVKLSRTGRALYVRPVAEIDGDVDLSRQENNHGLYSASRTPLLGPQSSVRPYGRPSQHITFYDKSRVRNRDGEKIGRFRETQAVQLHSERGFTFWRFTIEIELASRQTRIAYRVNTGPAIGFWVPARGETMNIMFHSCNGFSYTVDPDKFSGPDPLWRDVLNRHQSRPFHVMIGGGDQIYNDAAMHHTTLFKEYLHMKSPHSKHEADFTAEMQDELEDFFLNRYAMWFSQGFFAMANAQIPMVNIWDDHDIIDGYGSYPHAFMSTRVFTGLGAVAFKYYMLFQHQSVVGETEKEEPSWLLGARPGPYIQERSRSLFMSLGRNVSFLGLDCRTERTRHEVLSPETYAVVFDRCRAEITKGETKHLIVLLGVPIAYPRLNFLENMLTSRIMDPVKAIGRTGLLGGFVNKFDGGMEILDDLDDHWTAKHHKQERNWLIRELQDLAAEKSVRITILGGDVHLGAVGQFFSNRKLGIPKDRDHRYMPNIISSAIVNTPPPIVMADVLNKRNKVHHLDEETDEDMIPIFSHDVDGSRRNNNHLLPRRNFCIISEYQPGSTPPATPASQHIHGQSSAVEPHFDGECAEKPRHRRFPPGSMQRTMSLTRGPAKLVRRLSGSSHQGPPPISLAPEQTRPVNGADRRLRSTIQRANSLSAAGRRAEPSSAFPGTASENVDFERPTFKRRPTNFSEKNARRIVKAGAPDLDSGHIDLEGGLDISLCMEVDQHDPAGTTVPYRLLIPALEYHGSGDTNLACFSTHRKSLMDRLRLNRRSEESRVEGARRNEDDCTSHRGSSQGTRTPSPPPNHARQFDVATERNTHMNANPNPGYRAGAAAVAPPHPDSYAKALSPLSPPIAAPHPAQPGGWNRRHPTGAGPRYPDSGYRRARAPVSHRGPYGWGQDDDVSDGSLSDDENSVPTAPPQRRPSRVERYLGIGAAKNRDREAEHVMDREGELEDLGRTASGKKNPRWKIWR